MTVKILTNSGGVGLGNAVQMIPIIKYHARKGDRVISDTNIFSQLGLVCIRSADKYDLGYFTFAYRRNDMFKEILKHPFTKFKGYKWRFRNNYYGKRFIMPDFTKISEKDMNRKLWAENGPYYLAGHEPVADRVAIITSAKFIKRYEHWEDIIKSLERLGKDVRVYGDMKYLPYYVNTPTIKDFYNELRRCEYYYSTDCGGMHLADILGISGTVFWGESNIRQARPKNATVIRTLDLPYSMQMITYKGWLRREEQLWESKNIS